MRLSHEIVDALRVRLTPAEDKRLAEPPMNDSRAYEPYVLARQRSGASPRSRWIVRCSW
ncbi:MAG TPA: hypothetical protein VJ865_09650 [Gemmatimonadaceae bacterium]|nr:hypothetical protein [Gemmatimonadaceae bacterium]